MVGFEIAGLGFLDDFGWQFGTRGGLVPVEGFEVVADVLFVEGVLTAAGFVFVEWPESGAVGREHFVDEDEFAVENAELEFGVGDDDVASGGVIASAFVKLDAQFAGLLGDVAADDFDGLVEADVFVVALFGFGGWGEDRLGEL